MTDRELMQQALECMEAAIKAGDWKVDGACDPDFVLLCLRTRLAQPEPDPVAHLLECLGRWSAMLASDGEHADLSPPSWLCDAIKSATAPPQREWQGLTDEEVKILATQGRTDFSRPAYNEFYSAIEANLKEKNNG
jgi:hypothetical protein